MSSFTKTKELFLDETKDNFIGLANSLSCYERITQALEKPLKLILFYGKPGSGKTFLLQKIVDDLNDDKILFFKRPFFNEADFINALNEKIFGKNLPDVKSFENFMYYYTQNFTYNESEKLKFQKTIILDEAQLYPNDLLEKIRLMADSRYFKFIFTVHKTSDEELLAKGHFLTRIWESIELKNADVSEIKLYLLKKLKGCEIAFNDDDIALANELCYSNLRELNKLMYKFLDICQTYEHYRPSALTEPNFNQKALYMSAISLGIINA